MADENYEEDIFDDLYDDDNKPAPAAPAPPAEPEPPKVEAESAPPQDPAQNVADSAAPWPAHQAGGEDTKMDQSGYNNGGDQSYGHAPMQEENYGPINVKEDGKMFIGGLNWETTEESLKQYFSQYGEVSECTVMRDSATGRSRGFGFLTFRDAKCVNTVMVKEHYLDGKIIDPKRAIPREEQERTSKIFVGGVSQEATEEDFTKFFKQFGRVVDATLMMDKETGRPRGFGFVTFDGDAAVDATLRQPLQILGKPIEVKRAQPRGNMRDDEGGDKKFGSGGRGGNKFGSRDNGHMGGGGGGGGAGGFDPNQGGPGGANNGMTPAMMAQYWQRMQQYFQQMQQNLAAQQGAAGGMNPMAMQQMMAMQGGRGGPGGGMNPMAMQQQMMAMQGGPGGMQGGPTPAYTPQDQLAFEQQKYEQQQQRRMGGGGGGGGGYEDGSGNGSNYGGSAGGFNKNARGRQGSSQPPNAPVNAPTGPKNAGKPGANYRGGGRHGGTGFRHQPYGGRGG